MSSKKTRFFIFGAETDTDGNKVVAVYKGYKIYDKGIKPKYRFRYYVRDKKVCHPYVDGAVVANGETIEMAKESLLGNPNLFPNKKSEK